MTQYPPGAGPTGGQFSGTPWIPDQTTPVGQASAAAKVPEILTAAAQADSSGRMVATFTAPPDTPWLVRRITVQSTNQGNAYVYIGTQMIAQNLVSGTVTGDFDENETSQPYLIPAGQTMWIWWQQGGTCYGRIEYLEA